MSEDSFSRPVKTYFIQEGKGGPIKIGRSADPHKRLSDLQTSCASPLTLLGVLDDDVERELHRTFKHARIRRDGEWFRPTTELLRLVRKCRGKGRKSVRRDIGSPMPVSFASGSECLLIVGRLSIPLGDVKPTTGDVEAINQLVALAKGWLHAPAPVRGRAMWELRNHINYGT